MNKTSGLKKITGMKLFLPLVCLLAVLIAGGIVIPDFFSVSVKNGVLSGYLIDIINRASELVILAIGMTLVTAASGGQDISVGAIMAVAAALCCQVLSGGEVSVESLQNPFILAVLAALAGSALCGVFNGFLVAYLKIPAFIASMGSMMMSKGIGSIFTKTQTINWPQSSSADGWYKSLVRVGDVPVGLIILLAVAVICALILNRTKAGRYILCLGSNKEAVRLSGVNVKKWECLAYVICGILAGFAAIFYVGAFTSVLPGQGDTFNNEAIASCVMGGTSMSGGSASMGGTIIGTLIIALLQEGIYSLGLQKDWQYIITGLIVIVAVFLDVRSRTRRN